MHVSDKALNPVALREELGPEAVIGVTVADVGTALAMAKADIDYVQLNDDFDAERIAAFYGSTCDRSNPLLSGCGRRR